MARDFIELQRSEYVAEQEARHGPVAPAVVRELSGTLRPVTIVLDAGAVIAAERNDPLLTAIVKAAQASRTTMLLPATVLAETWRGAAAANVSAFLKPVTAFPELTERSARSAGVRLAKTDNPWIVDGNVVDIAISSRPSAIVTSDPSDIASLLAHAGVPHAIRGAVISPVDVTIVRI